MDGVEVEGMCGVWPAGTSGVLTGTAGTFGVCTAGVSGTDTDGVLTGGSDCTGTSRAGGPLASPCATNPPASAADIAAGSTKITRDRLIPTIPWLRHPQGGCGKNPCVNLFPREAAG